MKTPSVRADRPVEQKLGLRSPLVLAKLGHDMRNLYEDYVHEPVPEEMRRTLEHLPRMLPRLVEPQEDQTFHREDEEPVPLLGDDAIV